jgi:hypothetical protein
MKATACCHHQSLAILGPTCTVNAALGVDVQFYPGSVTINLRKNGDILCSQHSKDSTVWAPHTALGKNRE